MAPVRAGSGIGARRTLRLVADATVAIVVIVMLGVVAARLDRVETRQTAGSAVVNDGDTITISGQRIRLRGIDAPEYAQICRRDGASYRCGQKARAALVDLIANRPVSCSGWERDRYGRLLGQCVAGPVDLNRTLVREGWAIAYGDFESEESTARGNRSGLWAGEFDLPRQWRENHGGMVESAHDALGAIINWMRQIMTFSEQKHSIDP